MESFVVVSADGTRLQAWRYGGRGRPVMVSNGLGAPPDSWPGISARLVARNNGRR
jgi:3-oxoadipate enol-lactonase